VHLFDNGENANLVVPSFFAVVNSVWTEILRVSYTYPFARLGEREVEFLMDDRSFLSKSNPSSPCTEVRTAVAVKVHSSLMDRVASFEKRCCSGSPWTCLHLRNNRVLSQ